MTKIATTHTGSLPRPADLTELLAAKQEGREAPGLAERAASATEEIVRQQVETGIDLVNDGEQGKTGYSTYVQERLSGFAGEPTTRPRQSDLAEHEDFAEMSVRLRGRPSPRLPPCTAPITLVDPDAVHRDIANLAAAVEAAGIPRDRVFMSAASPGLIGMFFENQFYNSREEYLGAIADAMQAEYAAIVEAGFLLQVDCPDFAMSHNSVFQNLDLAEFRVEVGRSIEALNGALAGLPPERMRLHVCWGNYESPHTTDVALADLIDVIVTAAPAGISLEAANPRHGHEWAVFEEFKLPDDKYLVPGVIDTTTNFVEHPELIAQRLRAYVNVVGASRVIGSTDCGFDTFIGRDRVARSVVWAKLAALVAGAELASSSS